MSPRSVREWDIFLSRSPAPEALSAGGRGPLRRMFGRRSVGWARRRARLPRRYVLHYDDLAALRGRLDVERQFAVFAPSPRRLACRNDEVSADVASTGP